MLRPVAWYPLAQRKDAMHLVKAQQRLLLRKRRSIAALSARQSGMHWPLRKRVTRDAIAVLRRDIRSILWALVMLRKRERMPRA